MNEAELGRYIKQHYPKEDEAIEWKGWQNLKQTIGGRKGEDAISYISAISNMEGGFLIIGINDDCDVVGIDEVGDYTAENIKIRVLGRCANLPSEGLGVQEFLTKDSGKRVWVVSVPRHAARLPVLAHDQLWQRVGDSLIMLRPERLEAILREPINASDWSAEICSGIQIGDLDSAAIEELRNKWAKKTKREDFLAFDDEKTLRSLNLIRDNGVTNTAVVLLGNEQTVSRFLSGSEVIFEWRQDPTKTTHDFRASWRNAFMLFYEDVWHAIDARNLRIPFQEGLIQKEIKAFNEKSVREALLNAIAHRDYSLSNRSVFISASPVQFSIESPGGLLSGVTVDNILRSQAWRNRLLMETLEKIGLVERSGQGMDDIFRYTIAEGKGSPNLSKSDVSVFRLTIPASVKDIGFVRYIERVANQRQITFSTEDLIDLERIKNGLRPLQEEKIVEWMKMGIVERVGVTRAAKLILSRNYYQQEQKLGEHTRISGLSREATKALILEHISRHKRGYMHEFQDALPGYDKKAIANMLQELRQAQKIRYEGSPRNGHWTLQK